MRHPHHVFVASLLILAEPTFVASYDRFRFCHEGSMNQVGHVVGEAPDGTYYCWKIEGGKRGIKHGAKIILGGCNERDKSQLFVHCHSGRINGDGSWHAKFSPYIAHEYIVSVKREYDGAPLRLELRRDPPKDQESFYFIDNMDSYLGVGGSGTDCSAYTPTHPVYGSNIDKVDDTCLFVTTQGLNAGKGVKVIAKTAKNLKRREKNPDYRIITQWWTSDNGMWPPKDVDPPH